MSKVATIAWREFKQTVFRPVFLLAIIGIPLGIIVVMALAGYLMVTHEEPPLVGTVALVDADGELAEALAEEFEPEQIREDDERTRREFMEQAAGGGLPNMGADPSAMQPHLQRGEIIVTVERIDPNDDAFNEDELKAKVRSGDFMALAKVDEALLEPGELRVDDGESQLPESGVVEDETTSTAETSDEELPTRFDLYVAPDLDNDHVSLMESRIGQAIVRVRAARAGLDPQRTMAMFRAPRSSTSRVLETGEETAESEGMRELKQFIPVLFMVLLWVGVFTAGQHLLMSTIEEKSNRVMEVLLSAVSPMQLMAGKIFGHGGVGLLITGIYSAVGIGGLIAFAAMNLIEPMALVYMAVYFFMAYFMIASLMAAVGSAVSDIREANTLMTPVMLIVMIPWFLWMPINQAPNGAVAQAFSWIPPMTPFVMILRVSADEPVPFWQIPATIVWGYICVLAMMWMAAKIFRVGVLMYGKPPSPMQLVKWLRYS